MTLEDYQKTIATRPIRHFNINLTNQCNLRCYYCFAEHNPKNLSWETMQAIINFATNQYLEKNIPEDTLNFTFFGGEPMLRYDEIIVPTVNYIKNLFSEKKIDKKYWPTYSITTNGTLLTRERLEFFHENNFCILLSIDGDEESQNLNRPKADGTGSFKDVERNFKDLLELFPNTTFRSTLTPKTVDKIVDNYFFALDHGFKSYFLIPNECESWTQEEKMLLTQQILLIGEITYDYISTGCTPLYFSPLMKTFETCLLPVSKEKTPFRCGLGTSSVGVTTDGKLSGCQEYSSYIKEEDLFYIGDVFSGIDVNKHLQLLNSYLEKKHIESKTYNCNNCICYDICNRNTCPSKNYTLHEDMNLNSDIICHWKKTLYYSAEQILKKGAENNNLNLQNYLMHFLPKGVKM